MEDSLAATRSRRSNAGTRLKQLIALEEQQQKQSTPQRTFMGETDDDENVRLLFQEDGEDDEFVDEDVDNENLIGIDDSEEEEEGEGEGDDVEGEGGDIEGEDAAEQIEGEEADDSQTETRKRTLDDDDVLSNSDISDSDSDDMEGEKELVQLQKKKRSKTVIPAIKLVETAKPAKKASLLISSKTLLYQDRRASSRTSALENKQALITKLQESEERYKSSKPVVRRIKHVELTQEEKLAEAVETEIMNVQSLNEFRKLEIVKKERQRQLLMLRRKKLTNVIRFVSEVNWISPMDEVKKERARVDVMNAKMKGRKRRYAEDVYEYVRVPGDVDLELPLMKEEKRLEELKAIEDELERMDQADKERARILASNQPQESETDDAKTTEAAETKTDNVPKANEINESEWSQDPKPAVVNDEPEAVVVDEVPDDKVVVKEEKIEVEPFEESSEGKKKENEPVDVEVGGTVDKDEPIDLVPASVEADDVSFGSIESKDANVDSIEPKNDTLSEPKDVAADSIELKDVTTDSTELKKGTDSIELKDITADSTELKDVTPGSTEPKELPVFVKEEPTETGIKQEDEEEAEAAVEEDNELGTFEGPLQKIARNNLFLINFDTELDKSSIRKVIIGDNLLAPSRRFKDLKPVIRIGRKGYTAVVPQVDELFRSSEDIDETHKFFDELKRLPRLGTQQVFDETEETDEQQSDMPIVIRTEAPTGIYLSHNNNKKNCLISGKEVRYFDPHNGIPYDSVETYKNLKDIELGLIPWYSLTEDIEDYGPVELYLGDRRGMRHASGVPEGFD